MSNPVLFLSRLFLIALGLVGCATHFDIDHAEQKITPQQAVNNLSLVQDKTVAWGGVIVAGRNLASQTQLEVLSYPLDERGRPQSGDKAGGRFIALQPGYLELTNYAEGRLVTFTGKVKKTRRGKVGEAEYLYPVLMAKEMFLWPTAEEEASKPQFHFGVGVGVGIGH